MSRSACAGEPDAPEGAGGARADPRCELCRIAERRVCIERQVVREKRGVRAEERLEPASLTPVDDERLIAPEEPVMDEHHLRSLGGRPLEQCA
jgi:hypothetical protein